MKGYHTANRRHVRVETLKMLAEPLCVAGIAVKLAAAVEPVGIFAQPTRHVSLAILAAPSENGRVCIVCRFVGGPHPSEEAGAFDHVGGVPQFTWVVDATGRRQRLPDATNLAGEFGDIALDLDGHGIDRSHRVGAAEREDIRRLRCKTPRPVANFSECLAHRCPALR